MPLLTVTLLKGKSRTEKKQIADAIHLALVEMGVPEGDRFLRFLNLEKEDFFYDAFYPDMTGGRSDQFILIEILLSAGRSVKVKRKMLQTLVSELEKLGIPSKDVFVVFKENVWESWAYTAGNIFYA